MEDGYLKNFGMIIPSGPILRDDGTVPVYIKHKQQFIDHLVSVGRLEEIQLMTWAERDHEYLKWVDTMEVIPESKVKQEDGSILWTRERLIPKQSKL